MVTHLLGLFPHRKPASLSPLPHLANWCPRSRPLWGRSLLASQHPSSLPRLANAFPLSPPAWDCSLLTSPHPCSLTLGWLNPVHGLALAGVVPCSQSPHPCSLTLRWLIPVHGLALVGGVPCSQAGILLASPEMATFCPRPCTRWGCSLVTSRHPSSLTLRWPIPDLGWGCPLPDPQMADPGPWSRTRWGCSLIASRHPSSLTLRWLIPLHGRARPGAAPCSHPGIPVPLPSPRDGPFLSMVALSLRLQTLRQPASHFALPDMASSCLRSRTLWGCSLLSSQHSSSLTRRCLLPARGHALAVASPSAPAAIALSLPEMATSCAS